MMSDELLEQFREYRRVGTRALRNALVEEHIGFADFLAGWVKSFVFAVAIAGIGCLRGLQTGAGASAVGDSATRAVVSGLVLIVLIDGVFAVIYFFLDI